MVHLIVSVSRFSMLFMIAIYTYYCFATLKKNISERRQTRLYKKKQTTLMYGL